MVSPPEDCSHCIQIEKKYFKSEWDGWDPSVSHEHGRVSSSVETRFSGKRRPRRRFLAKHYMLTLGDFENGGLVRMSWEYVTCPIRKDQRASMRHHLCDVIVRRTCVWRDEESGGRQGHAPRPLHGLITFMDKAYLLTLIKVHQRSVSLCQSIYV